MARTLKAAYETEFWTARAPEVKALGEGLPLATWDDFANERVVNSSVVRWEGHIPGAAKLGHFWCPNPYRGDAVRGAMLAMGKGDFRKGFWAVRTNRLGLKATDVARLSALVMEVDNTTIAQQLEEGDRIASEGGFEWGAAVLSGDARRASADAFTARTGLVVTSLQAGKSIHFYLWLDHETVNPENLKAWHEAQELLGLLMGGDTSMERLSQPARLPGAWHRNQDTGETRLQTILTFDNKRWKLAEIVPLLRGVAEARYVDVQAALDAQREAARLLRWAQKNGRDTRLATTIMDTRTITPEQRAEIDALTDGEHRYAVSGEVASGTRVKLLDSGTWTTIDEAAAMGGFTAHTCPLHDHRDSHRAHAWTSEAGNRWMRCFGSEGGIFHIQDSFELTPEEDENCGKLSLKAYEKKACHNSTHNPPHSGSANTRSFTKVRGYKEDNLIEGRFLPHDPLEHRVTFLRGDKGIGKTEFMAACVKSLPQNGRAVVSAHLRSLCRQAAERYTVPLYLETRGTLTDSCVVSLDSLHRLDLETDVDLLVIDEIQQYLQAFNSGTMNGTEAIKAYTTFTRLVRNAKRIVVADADLDLLAVDFIMGLLGDVTSELRVVKTRSPYTYALSKDKASVEAAITTAWLAGERIAVAMMAKDDVESMAKFLQNQRPDAKIGVVNSLRVIDLKAEITADPNGWASQHDAIVYSPTLGTGISFDQPDLFDSVFGMFYASVGTAQAAFQMLHRVRHPRNKTITFWAASGGSLLESRAEKIERQMLARMFRTRAQLASQGMRVDPMLAEADPEFLSLYARCTAYSRTHGAKGGHLFPACERYLRVNGLRWELVGEATPEQSKALHEARKVARDETREKLATEMLAAPSMPSTDEEPRTVAEALGIRKTHLEDFYGEAVSADMLKRDKNGRYRDQIRMFARATALSTKGAERDVIELRHAALTSDLRDSNAGVTSHLHAYGYRAELLATCLRAYGVSLRDAADAALDGVEYHIDHTRWEAATANLVKHRRKLSEWGITLPQDAITNGRHGRVLASLLLQVGLSLTYDKRRVKGTKEFEYTNYRLEPVALDRAIQLGSRWLTTQLAGVPGAKVPGGTRTRWDATHVAAWYKEIDHSALEKAFCVV